MTEQDREIPGATPRQRAIEAYAGARDRTVGTLSEAPLIALAGGLAAGALIAALLPRTGAETRAIRPTARRVKDSAKAALKAAKDTGSDSSAKSGSLGRKARTRSAASFRGSPTRLEPPPARRSMRRAKADLSVKSASEPAMSKLHLVFGGRVKDPRTLDFDLNTLDLVGIYDSYAAAEDAWRGRPSALSTMPR